MKKLSLVFTFVMFVSTTQAMEKWNKAYEAAMKITPGLSFEEQNALLDETHNNLSQANDELRNSFLNNEPNPTLVHRATNNNYASPNTNVVQSSNTSSHAPASRPSRDGNSTNKLFDEKEKEQKKIVKDKLERGQNKNRLFPSVISHKKALILGGISLGGWIAYRNTDRIAEYCSTINNRKLLKTCFYVGAGSAVLIASLYGYKKIMGNKAQSDKKAKDVYGANSNAPMPTTKKRNNTLDYSSLSNEELQAMTRQNEQKIAETSARQKNTQHASDKRAQEVKERAEKVDNQSEVAGIFNDLGDAFEDVVKDPGTPAHALTKDVQRKAANIKNQVKETWNQFTNWLNS